MKFLIDDIVKATNGKLMKRGLVPEVHGISIDSREVKSGNCFLALQGPHYNGLEFVSDAIKKGAVAAIVSGDVSVDADVSIVRVGDPVRALGDIASLWRSNFSAPCIAITGSNGKSTTKQMTAAALDSMGNILKTEGNFNNLIGLPLTIFRWRKDHSAAVVEMGMNAPGEIARLTEIARPDVGVITNVSAAHLELLGTIENVAKTKGELFDKMSSSGMIIVNLEDPMIREVAKGFQGKRFTFGMGNDADIRFGRMESMDLESIDMIVYIEGKEYTVHLSVPGTHNVMNAMAALSIARVLGVSPEDAINGLENFEPMAMRMERILLSKGIQLVNDCYNANPLSVREALRTVYGAKKAGRFIAVLGDMLELGDESDNCHKEIGSAAAEYHVDRLFAFGPHSASVAIGAKKGGLNSDRVSVYTDMEELKNAVLDYVDTGDIVLVKGSRGMQMERVVDCLKDEIGVE